jgi:hypothetical protein
MVQFLQEWVRKGIIFVTADPLPSVNDILDIAENELKENAIFIAQTEIDWLDDLSLEGDVPDNNSDTSEAALFQVPVFLLECPGLLFQVLDFYSWFWNFIPTTWNLAWIRLQLF